MVTSVPTRFGDLLRSQRLAAGLTQEALAGRAGLSADGIQKLERGISRPQRETARRLVMALDLSGEDARAFQGAASAPRQRRTKSPSVVPEQSRHNLPAALTSFIGREQELAAVRLALERARLVTLIGVGGCGKSRLAIQAATGVVGAFADGVWLTELASLADQALVGQTVAHGLGVRVGPGGDVTGALVAALRPRRLLLLLDNCEHLLDACAGLVEALLRACPEVQVLATSREALRVPGEVVWRVPSLSIPDLAFPAPATPDRLGGYEAVRLFVERAAAASPTFTLNHQNAPAVAQLCARLDGLPLAIELAAARVTALTPEQLTTRLDQRFRLLTGGSRTAVPRQQTLRAAMDWSYQLLSSAERTLLRRLSVFAGGWTLDAAEAVCSGDDIESGDVLDVLTSLVAKSLVVAEGLNGEERYWLLETIRQYASEQSLTQSAMPAPMGGSAGSTPVEVVATRARHRDWYLALAERARPHIPGPELRHWLDVLEREQDNLRAALRWCIEGREPGPGLRLADALALFWYYRGHGQEASAWLRELLALPGDFAGDPVLRAARARGLAQAGTVAMRRDDLDLAAAWLEESLALRRGLDDIEPLVRGLYMLGNCRICQGRHVEARELLLEARAAALSSALPFMLAEVMDKLGAVAFGLGDLAGARTALEEAVSIRRDIGPPAAASFEWLGNVALAAGRTDEAQALYDEALALGRRDGVRVGVAHSLQGLGLVAIERGDAAAAEKLLRECLVIQRDIADWHFLPVTLDGLAGLAALRVGAVGIAAAERALRLASAARALRGVLGPAPHWHTALAERWLVPVYAALGGRDTPAAAAARAAGASMTAAQAADDALVGHEG